MTGNIACTACSSLVKDCSLVTEGRLCEKAAEQEKIEIAIKAIADNFIGSAYCGLSYNDIREWLYEIYCLGFNNKLLLPDTRRR